MRKLFTSIATVAMAVVLTLSASAVNPTAKAKRGAAPAKTEAVVVKGEKNLLQKGGLSLRDVRPAKSPFASVQSLYGNPLKANKMFRAPVARAIDGRDVVAVNVFDEASEGYLGLVNFPEKTVIDADFGTCDAGVAVDGKYIVTYLNNGFFGTYFCTYVFDYETWEMTYANEVGFDGSNIDEADNLAYTMCADPTSGLVYGVFFDGEGTSIEKLDLATYDPENLCRLNTIAEDIDLYYSMAFDAAGQLYGIDLDGNLYKINKTTGEATLAFATGLATKYLTSGTIVGDKYYWAVCTDDEMALYAIDLATGAAENLGDLGGEYMGMSVIPAAAEDGAPAAAENVAANFAAGALAGNVTFKAPTATFGGSALSGTLNYKVLANGEEAASGVCAPGDEVTANVAVTAPGQYTFAVVVSNATGDSPQVKVNLWVGADAPKAAANVVATGDFGAINVSWDAVTEGVHAGYFDASAVTYTVTRYVNGATDAVIADGISATSLVDDYTADNLVSLVYGVVADFDGAKSAPAYSAALALGTIVPPYIADFTTADTFTAYTMLDGNGDGKVWTYYAGGQCMRMTYNASMDMDDYLVLPAVQLEGGKAYNFTVSARSYSASYPERFEVVFATAPTLEACQAGTVIIEPVDLPNEYADYEGTVVPATTGKYFFAIHGISDADEFYLEVNGIEVSAPIEGTTPDVVTDVVFVPATDGTPSAAISFKAPEHKINGQALDALTKVEVLRGDEVVKTFDAPAPGAELSFTDVAPAAGDYDYTFVAYNADGAGKSVVKSVYLGVGYAACPLDVTCTEWANAPGKVTISWTPVAEDLDGNAIDGSLITYTILDKNQEVVAEDIPFDEPEYTFVAVPEGEQEFVYYFLLPVTEKGFAGTTGTYAVTDMIPVGTAYEMPVIETITPDGLNYIWGQTRIEGNSSYNSWGMNTSCSNPSATPYGDDGAMLYWWPLDGEAIEFYSGKIHVDETEAVAFSFYYHETAEAAYEIMPIVKVAGMTYDLLDSPISTEAEDPFSDPDWKQVLVSLVDYCGTDVQLGWRAECFNSSPYLLIDQIEAKTFCSYDLGVKNVKAPKAVEVGQEATISATIMNYGLMEAGEFTVDLLCNGEKTETVTIDGLGVNESTEVVFDLSYDVFSDVMYTYQVQVNYAEDENEANNLSDNVMVIVSQSMLPAVEDLAGEMTDAGFKLTWSDPDTAAGTEEMVDDVESYESFAINQAGDWTFIDADASEHTYGFNGISFPGAYEPMAWIVFDNTDYKANLDGIVHSGDKAFLCFAAETAPNDDWMISPMLPGVAQTVSFFARSWTVQYGSEEFKFYYSTTSDAIADMILLGEVHDVPAEWTEYSYDLPEGAKYFAIECVSNDRFILCVDDISFTAGTPELTLKGYDVYRDQECIAENVQGNEYVDADYLVGEHWYYVVANYDLGSSALSNDVYANIAPATIGVIGAIEGGEWNPGNVAMLEKTADGVFAGTVTFTGEWFSLCEHSGADWGTIGLRWGAPENGWPLEEGAEAPICLGLNDNAFKLTGVAEFPATGVVTVDFNTLTLKVTELVGIDGVMINGGEAIYFNIQGIRVNNPENGAYIRLQDGKAEKVYNKK